ncbi:MAG: hypothetical protein CL928_09580 [Deltaproteobacteria bacterium]|nr:hypothetical protein [Deltaproteobacteria bacterium]
MHPTATTSRSFCVLSMVLGLCVLFSGAAAEASSGEAESATVSDGGYGSGDVVSIRTGSSPDVSRFEENAAFAAWQKEHRWFRVGLRFHGHVPAVQEHAALKLGAGFTVPVTTDFFMGLGMKIGFMGTYNRGDECVDRGGQGDDDRCSSGWVGGVDYNWRVPRPLDDAGNLILDEVATGQEPSGPDPSELMGAQRRSSHVASFSLTIGANYELTLPHIRFFRIFQPFIGGGLVLSWVHTYSDILADEFVLIDNDENNPLDENNLDPWSSQGPEVGGEIYGGFHLNVDKLFRVVVELGYSSVDVPSVTMKKATANFEMTHFSYRLSQFRFGGGFEFKF